MTEGIELPNQDKTKTLEKKKRKKPTYSKQKPSNMRKWKKKEKRIPQEDEKTSRKQTK